MSKLRSFIRVSSSLLVILLFTTLLLKTEKVLPQNSISDSVPPSAPVFEEVPEPEVEE